jgi:hypothetical protein
LDFPRTEVFVSTAASTKPPAATGYSLAKPLGRCCVCGRTIEVGQKMVAALRENPAGFERLDLCLECAPSLDKKNVLASWQAMMPPPQAKPKIFVDDEVLKELFVRLAEAGEPIKVSFRFMLGLVLMRKRLLAYDSTRKVEGQAEGREIWSVRLKGSEESMDLVNPRLDERQLAEVAAQMGEILNQEIAP